MSVFESITRKVTDTARMAAKKSGELVEVTKLNMSISSEEDKIEKVYIEIGREVYQRFAKGEDVGVAAFSENCEKVKQYEENIKEMRKKILDLRNIKICSACSAELGREYLFCSNCGAKQEVPSPEVLDPIEKICTSCNMTNDLNSTYCTKCGAKLDE